MRPSAKRGYVIGAFLVASALWSCSSVGPGTDAGSDAGPTGCPEGNTVCGAGATRYCADLQNAATDCGACGAACPMGQTCSAGVCQTICVAPAVACPGATGASCVELSVDSTNCGACGRRCANGEICLGGMCSGTPCLPAQLSVGARPTTLETRELNGDGRPDLIVANSGDSTISVLLSGSGGALTLQAPLMLSAAPEELAVADFNGEGTQDLAVIVASSNQLQTFIGRDGGSFVPGPQAQLLPDSRQLAVGDFNNDSRADLLVAATLNPLGMLLGSADGGFLPIRSFDAGVLTYAVRAGDFDSDGNDDALIQRIFGTDSDLQIHYGDGSGNLTAGAVFGSGAKGPIVGDVNADGLLDVVSLQLLGGSPNSIVVWLNRGNRVLERASSAQCIESLINMVLADLNADGEPEIIQASRTRGVGVLMNRGDGSFTAAVSYGHLGSAFPTVADFTGDGVPDVAVSNLGSASLSVLPNVGDGRLVAPALYVDDVYTEVGRSRLADLDGDGTLDLAGLLSDFPAMKVGVRFNQGRGVLGPLQLLDAVPSARELGVPDVNGDGVADLVTADDVGSVSVFPSSGDGGFLPLQTSQTGLAARSLDVADFSGDQRADLLVGAAPGLGIAVSTGSASFSSPAATPGVGNVSRAIAADFDGDGRSDVAVADDGMRIRVFSGTGDGGLRPTPVFTSAAVSARDLEAGDFNGDGALDLAFERGDLSIALLLNERDGGFRAVAPFALVGYPAGFSPVALRDGGVGLIVPLNGLSNTPMQVSVLTSDSAGTLSKLSDFAVADAPQGVVLGDLDRDGRVDVVTTHRRSHLVFPNVCLP